MNRYINAFRYLAGTLAISAAFALVCFAQQASGARPAQAQAQQAPKEVPADRIAGMVAEWTRARDYTKEYLDTMPEDGLSLKPTPEIRSFSEQMLHLAAGFYFFAKPVLGVDPPTDPRTLEKDEKANKSKAALTKTVMDSYDLVIAQIKTMTPAKLDETVTVFGTKMPRHVAIAKMFEHQTHHRGQTTIYIRMKGIKPPNERLF